jgi:predicted GNAT superfamily acetyltransferase
MPEMEADLIIRTLHSPAEMRAAVELQKIYWGDDMSDIVPLHMLLSMAHYGGQVLGAFVDDRMVGLLIGFLGAKIQPGEPSNAASSLLLMSKRMVVLPEYRNYKIGERLKLAQRDYAIEHGIQLVTWTFDPLLSRNAYLNLHKLGAVGQAYQVDFFGQDAANPTLSGDRLVANWWVIHPHTQDRSSRAYGNAPVINEVKGGTPVGFELHPANIQLLELPSDFQTLEHTDPAAAGVWRSHMREAFQMLLSAGYIATDVLRQGEQSFYVFTKDDGSFTFR